MLHIFRLGGLILQTKPRRTTPMKDRIGQSLKACGSTGLPPSLIHQNREYHLQQVFKHDFFAATALYATTDGQSGSPRLVLKISRSSEFLGLPLDWLGRWLCEHEHRILTRLQGICGIPQLAARWRRNGLIYLFIEGDSLDQKPALPDDFFDRLNALVQRIHQRNIVYLDMNKRGNILLGEDGNPYLIDYQISFEIPTDIPIVGPFVAGIQSILEKEDFYHIFKHKRHFRRDLMTPEQVVSSKRVSFWVSLHRLATRPLTRLRRAVLHWLARKDYLDTNDVQLATPENDPGRWKPKSNKQE